MATGAAKIIVAKGRKLTTFEMKTDPPDEETLMSHMLGATGNLRAPTIISGKTVLIGFNEQQYTSHLL